MGREIKRNDEVWTADEKQLGIAKAVFHRTDEVNPALRLYASYLEVEDFNFGENFYVPTDFIDEGPAGAGRIEIKKKRDEAMQLLWFRMPDFVAKGNYRKEALPE